MTMKKDPALDGWKPRALSGFVELVGPLWTRKEDEAWSYGLLAEAKHTNAVGIVHGGVLTTLLDHALSAIAWEANERKPCVTVALDVHFLEAVRPGDLIVARGRSSARLRRWRSCTGASPWTSGNRHRIRGPQDQVGRRRARLTGRAA
jgi:uncharacterized protein (TIGR00369 family)